MEAGVHGKTTENHACGSLLRDPSGRTPGETMRLGPCIQASAAVAGRASKAVRQEERGGRSGCRFTEIRQIDGPLAGFRRLRPGRSPPVPDAARTKGIRPMGRYINRRLDGMRVKEKE
jgi:hypothetical protein